MDTRSKKFSNNIVLRVVVFLICVLCVTVFCLSFVMAVSEDNLMWRIDRFMDENDLRNAENYNISEIKSELWYGWMPLLAPCGFAGVISLLWLMITTGARKYSIVQGNAEYDEEGSAETQAAYLNPRRSYLFDRIWTEVQIAGVVFAVWCGCFIIFNLWYDHFSWSPVHPVLSDFMGNGLWRESTGNRTAMFSELQIVERLADPEMTAPGYIIRAMRDFPVEVPVMASGFLLCTGIALWFALSLIRIMKSGRFFRNALIVQFFMFVGGGIGHVVMGIVNGGSLMRKVVVILCGIAVLSATIVGAPIMIVLIIVFAPKWVKRFEAIQHGVDEVKSGNLEYKIPIKGGYGADYGNGNAGTAHGGGASRGGGAFGGAVTNGGVASGGVENCESRRRKVLPGDRAKEDELTRLARGINEISQASNEAVKNELKNQRMKTDLISNVSHDLKTPLTSLVTYIDLLKAEGLDSPNAPEYLAILDAKTDRLRKLTEDLFEAAKASSGAMPVNMGSVDALALVKQVMGEMNDRIDASGLEFILKSASSAPASASGAAAPAKHMAEADGQLLYRVVDNLLNNVLKYALPGSRVYIDISEPLASRLGGMCNAAAAGGSGISGNVPGSKSRTHGTSAGSTSDNGLVLIEFKNISAQALNIDPDELMERFKRGDESRTTEGSGLGLAIAKDLVKLMGGWLELTIDGDFFKASVYLNKSPQHKKPDPAEAV